MEPYPSIALGLASYREAVLLLDEKGLEPLGVIETPTILYERIACPSSYKGIGAKLGIRTRTK